MGIWSCLRGRSCRLSGCDFRGLSTPHVVTFTPILTFPRRGGRNCFHTITLALSLKERGLYLVCLPPNLPSEGEGMCGSAVAAVVAEGAVAPFEGGFKAVLCRATGEFFYYGRLVRDGVGLGGNVLEGVAPH